MTNEHYLEVAKEQTAKLNEVITDYIADYEFRGDEGDYYPNDVEQMLITDAIFGLLEDDDFKAAYPTCICAEKDAEIAKLYAAHEADGIALMNAHNAKRDAEEEELKIAQELDEANAAIAIKDEALKEVRSDIAHLQAGRFVDLREVDLELGKALSASPESIAAWEAEKLLPLQRQVAMLSNAIDLHGHDGFCKELKLVNGGICTCKAHNKLTAALFNTQATAEAYDRGHAAKVLEETSRHPQFIGGSYARILENMAAEKRATKQVKE